MKQRKYLIYDTFVRYRRSAFAGYAMTPSQLLTQRQLKNNYNDRKKMNMFDRINLRVDIYVYIELKVPYFDAAD